MPTPPAPRRPLSKVALPFSLSSSKTQTYSDASRTSSHNPSSSIRSIAWSPLGSLIATASSTLRVWNPEKAHVRSSTELRGHGGHGGHVGAVERVAFNPTKEAELASVGVDGIVRFWDVRAPAGGSGAATGSRGGGGGGAGGLCTGEVKVGEEGFSLAWRPDGQEVVVGRKDDTLIAISRATLSQLGVYPQAVQTNQIAFSNSGSELFLTTGDSQVKIVDYPSMETIHTLHAHTSSCYTVAPCPKGRYIATGGSDALITLYDTTDFVCKRSLAEMTGPVRSLSFSWDGSFVVGGSDEGTGLMVAHVETGEYIHTIPTNHPAPYVAWHPHRYWLAYSGDPTGLKIVGAAGGSL